MRDKTMRCPQETGEGVEIILAYLGDRLGPGKRDEFVAHLDECEGCQELLLAQSVVFDALEAWNPEPVSAGFDRDLYARIEAEEARGGWWRRLFGPGTRKPAMVLATACLLVVAGFLMRPVADSGAGNMSAVEPVDIEQVEQAVEDLEMLYLLDNTAAMEEEAEEEPAEEGLGVVSLSRGAMRLG
jgi:hypothetical protein